MLFIVGGIVALGNSSPQVIAAPSVEVDWMVSHLQRTEMAKKISNKSLLDFFSSSLAVGVFCF